MANPIKASDLYLDDGAIKRAIEEWKKFRDTYLSAMQDMRREAESLRNSQRTLNGALKEHRDKILQTAQAASNLQGSYSRYQSALNKTEAQLRKLELAQEKLAEAKKKSKRVTDDQVDSNAKLGKSFSDLARSVKGFLSVYLGFAAARDVARNIFKTTRELDSLERAFRQVTKTQENYMRSQVFLKEITQDFGMETLSTSRAYMKFLAAIQTTNLGVEKAESIFRSFSKVNAILGLRADESKGVFLALEQMISKGKVSTEELRLQMGERIPGAFQIMAKAVGVTSSELSKMLKQGKVMSADVMPKFAQELEKAFGVEKEKSINTLATAQARLSNAWVEFVEALDKAEVFQNVMDTLASMLKFITSNMEAIKLFSKAILVGATAWATYRATLITVNTLQKLNVATTIASGVAMNGMTTATRLATIATQAFNLAMRANPLGIVLSLLGAVAAAMLVFKDEVVSAQDSIQESYNRVGESSEKMAKDMRGLIETYKDESNSIEERQAALAELNRIAPDYVESLNLEKTSLEELIVASDKYNDSLRQRALIEDINQKIALENVEINKLQKDIDLVKAGGITAGLFGSAKTGAGPTAELPWKEQELRDRLERVKEFSKQIEMIKAGTDELGKLPTGVDTGLDGEDEDGKGTGKKKRDPGALGSLRRLKDAVKKIEEEIEVAEPGQVPGLMAKLINAKEAVEEAEKWLASLESASKETGQEMETIQNEFSPIDVFNRSIQKRTELEKELIEKRIEKATEAFEQEQELARTGFALFEHTELEKKKFAIQQEQDKLKKMLELNERYGGNLTEIQRQIIRNQIQGLQQEMQKLDKGGEKKSIYDMIGIDITDKGKEALKQGFDFVKSQVMSFFQLQRQLANQRVSDSNKAVSQAQRELDAQIRLAELGYANKVDQAKKDLELAKETQKKALRQREKAAKAELAIQTIEQGVNLVTASTKILKDVPFPFSLAAIGIMFGAFAAAKIKAFQLTKQKFGEGGLEIIGGGTHASGDDTPLGFAVKGRPAYAEKDEAHAIIKADMSRKYRKLLPVITDSLNKGEFEKVFSFQRHLRDSGVMPGPTISTMNVDMSETESHLKAIRDQNSSRIYTDASGRIIEVKGNRKTIYS